MIKKIKAAFVAFIGADRYHRYITSTEQLIKSVCPFHGTGKALMQKELIKAGDVILDIGANIGRFASFACPLVGREGRVVCFEPVLHARQVLKRMKRLRRFKQVEIAPIALSDRVDTLEMAIPLKRGWKLQTSTAHIHSGGTDACCIEKVPVMPLDHFCRNHNLERIDFIKCDTEGYEYFVFRGGREVLSKYRPVVYCEIEEPYVRRQGISPQDVFEIFQTLGYRAFMSVEEDKLLPVNSYHERGDYFFFPPSRFSPRLNRYVIQA